MKRTYTQLLQLTCFLCILFVHESWSQIKLGENPKTISPYALLELESISKGLIIPRMTSTQRDSAFDQNTPVGTLIYNTEDDQLQYFSEMLDPSSRALVKIWQPASNAVPSSSNTDSATLAETAQDGNMFYDATTNILYAYNTQQEEWIPVGGNINEVPENAVFQGNQMTFTQSDGTIQSIDLEVLADPYSHAQTLSTTGLSSDNNIVLEISHGNSVTLDLSALDYSGSDNQNLTANTTTPQKRLNLQWSAGTIWC